MKEALKKLIEKWACMHRWKKIKEYDYFSREHDRFPTRFISIFVCTKCGKFKKMVVMA